ncbi:MAG TPA: hypothetical protein VMR59_03890 [Patescibacteria group bacterium]|nr:hypothetical protein [Patescibacteria group bacterium]
MAYKKIKQLNFGYLLEQESKIKQLTEKTYKKPLKTLDEATKFFMTTLDFALKIQIETKDKQIKNYCTFYLTQGNAILHLIRTSRMALVYGYYGSIAVLTRTFINYLNLAIYIHHHPEDVGLLLKESRDDFKKNPEFKKKFHEANIKKELLELGYTGFPDDIAKLTHGSMWASQVFGFKEIKSKEDEHELNYSPKYSNLQSSTYLPVILAWPVDFPTYFIIHLSKYSIKGMKDLQDDYSKIDSQVGFAINAIENSYQFMKNVPEEVQKAILKRIEKSKE